MGEVSPIRRPKVREPATQLPSPAPLSEPKALKQWLSVVLGVGADTVTEVKRYGRTEDAHLVVTLRSGTRVVFDRQRDMFDRAILCRKITIATGAAIPHYGGPDAQKIATALIRAAELVDQADDRDEARDWAASFVQAAESNAIEMKHAFGTRAGKLDALHALQRWRSDLPSYAPVAERAALVRDPSGARWVRVSEVAAHVRQMSGGRIAWGTLASRLVEIGWTNHGELQQWNAGRTRKVKGHVFEVPADWESAQ